MPTLKVTAKRQTTFPLETCEDLQLKPGDRIQLEKRVENGETLWVLRPQRSSRKTWVARLAGRVDRRTDHSMAAIRKSIASKRTRKK